MKTKRTSLNLKRLTIVVTLAVLAAAPVHATAASTIRGSASTVVRGELAGTGRKADSPQLTRNQLPPKLPSASYFWIDAGVLAAVLAGLVLLGLWGDVAVGGIVFGIWVIAAAVCLAIRKAYVHIRHAFADDTASSTTSSEARTATEVITP